MKSCRFHRLMLLVVAALFLAGAALAESEPLDYSDQANWAYFGTSEGEAAADVFFLCPSAFGGKEDAWTLDLSNEKGVSNFIGCVNMEKGIYDQNTRFYAPFYRQIGYKIFGQPESEALLDFAYQDVRAAFTYYLEHENEGRPILLAGFSQGADMALKLMKDVFADADLQDQLIACYALGFAVTEEDIAAYPHLKMAQESNDIGVIVSFNAEAEDVEESIIIPAGLKTLSINPLNWATDSTPAAKEENLGACFTDYEGSIVEEVPALTGAYLDEARGALKVTDIDPEVYDATLSILTPGVYHLYDYQFFYRNLQQNVQARIAAWQDAH